MTAACDACKLAEARPDYPRYRYGCRGCNIRELALGPLFHASGVDGSLSRQYRVHLAGIFGDDWRSGHELVKAAAKRIRESKALL